MNPQEKQIGTTPGKGGDQTLTASEEIKRARGRAGFSIILNLSLALLKGVAGVLSGSAALLGDAVHSATDVVGSGRPMPVFGWPAGAIPPFPMACTKLRAWPP